VTTVWTSRIVSVSITAFAITGFIHTICTHIYQNSMVAKLINLTPPLSGDAKVLRFKMKISPARIRQRNLSGLNI